MSTAEINEFSRGILDVCSIFEDVVGVPAVPTREAAAIVFWIKEGWQNYEFRLVIDWEFKDLSQKEFYSHPSNLNLRAMLNPKRKERLLDLVAGLRAKQIAEKKKKEAPLATMAIKFLLKCGAKIYREDYDAHMNECFATKGLCFYPQAS